eukprot:5671596-Pleurochrysis_carterae.AAC.3
MQPTTSKSALVLLTENRSQNLVLSHEDLDCPREELALEGLIKWVQVDSCTARPPRLCISGI